MNTQSLNPIPHDQLQNLRQLFPHTQKGVIYLNHAAVSPLSTRVVRAQTQHLQDRSSGKIETFFDDLVQIEETKRCIQRLINAESYKRIALVGNTSDALNVVASGIDWKPGDRVLLNDQEFPANIYPYYHLKSQGVEVDIMRCADGRVTPELIYSSLQPRTRLLALSAVQFLSGYRADMMLLGDLCRSKGIIFAVDGIQAIGAIKLDVQAMKIDAMAAGAPKWQMGPQGIGFLYLTEELQARVHQKYLGWLSVENPFDFSNWDQALDPNARRYEGGTVNIPGMWGMHAALSTLLEVGPSIIESHILGLTQTLMDELVAVEGVKLFSPTTLSERAGIVTIEPPKNVDPTAAFQELTRREVFISLRNGKFRYSPHFYNSREEILSAASNTKDVLQKLSKQ
ncbi:MAG: aminotransferase class V-fold PLP-dependent enzyme [Ignavibacteriales bacterium]|nr:aminotransferase class V-fold PLP-dependent enzyme [Ignavibacteriales bacterium]